jgi:hypothetical protein
VSAERVQEAAIRFRGRTFVGQSHKVAVWVAARALALSPTTVWAGLEPRDFGFTTTRGRFVSRANAWVIAAREGQLRLKHVQPGVTPEFHSEDLR